MYKILQHVCFRQVQPENQGTHQAEMTGRQGNQEAYRSGVRLDHLRHSTGCNDQCLHAAHGLLQLGYGSLFCDVCYCDVCVLCPGILQLPCALQASSAGQVIYVYIYPGTSCQGVIQRYLTVALISQCCCKPERYIALSMGMIPEPMTQT